MTEINKNEYTIINDESGGNQPRVNVDESINEYQSLINQHNSLNDKRFGCFSAPTIQFIIYHSLFVFLSIVYLSIAVALPFLNKAILGSYNYPLTSSLFQTLGAVTILLIFNLIQYRYQKYDLVQKSYFFDRNFLQKSIIMIPVSICFALVMILTNIAIQMVPVDYHVVIKSTNIIWVVLFSILINKEKPSIFEYLSIVLLLIGTLLVSLVFAKEGEGTAKSIIVNLLSSFFESLTIVVLKWACTYLYRIDDTISVIEISLFKVVQGSIAIAIPMLFIDKLNGFKVLPELQNHVIWLLVSGIFITMVYQTCTVWLSKSMYSTTVGIISQLQIIPQEFISIISGSFISSSLHIVGVVLSALGCVCFSFYHFFKIFNFKKSEFKSNIK